MKTPRTIVLATALLVSAADVLSAHSWYPEDCCSGEDCAPVMSIRQAPEGRYVTSKHGTVLVPAALKPRRSEDGDFHVCMTTNEAGLKLLQCFFEPAGS